MSAYPRPIHCVRCERDLIPYKNGVFLIEMAWHPRQVYKIWCADLWKCPGCGVEIISGYGNNPTRQHEENFPHLLEVAIQGQHYFNYEGGEKE
jgi:hypothetical protein